MVRKRTKQATKLQKMNQNWNKFHQKLVVGTHSGKACIKTERTLKTVYVRDHELLGKKKLMYISL